MFQQQRTQISQELQGKIKEETLAILPEVNVMLQKQYLCLKRDVEARCQREQAEMQQMRALVQQEAQAFVANERTLMLPEIQQNRASTMEEVQAMVRNERLYTFEAMQEIMKQQLTTIVDATNSELGRLVTMVNAVSSGFEERVIQL